MKKLIIAIMAIGLLAVGCNSNSNSDYYDSSSYSAGSQKLTPSNPYSPGSGHYAGFEYAEKNEPPSCSGRSTSFEEGCEEYFRQLAN